MSVVLRIIIRENKMAVAGELCYNLHIRLVRDLSFLNNYLELTTSSELNAGVILKLFICITIIEIRLCSCGRIFIRIYRCIMGLYEIQNFQEDVR